MGNVLEGVRVLDFGRFIAGPFCAALLADYGADVIRIDRVGGSEDRFILPVTPDGDGAVYLQVNRNKRSITLDLDRREGREVVRRLLQGADVVVANMPQRTLESLGLDYESLRRLKPDIILTAASAFGIAPAVRDRTGFDGVAQCMSGAVHVSGDPHQPIKSMVPVVDYGTAMSSAMGTMMALYERKSSGMGQEVTGSLMQTALNMSSGHLIEEAVLRLDRSATRNRAPQYAPSDIFRVKDGWIMTQVVGTAMFKRWSRMIGRPDLASDVRFDDDAKRGLQGELLGGWMSEWCARYTRAEALSLLAEARLPAGPVNSPREVLADPDIRAAGAFQPMKVDGIEEPVPFVSPPVSLSRTPPAIRRPAPKAGEHTDAILREIGYPDEAIDALRRSRVV
ncbi:CaiB/BaiF CoA transferase family protein [Ramlibacter sp.]|uniref:CaiB/BaiF CoA transferase family protein n=1 Tax=Ramlibacter sp. TaxID=1917967 RepID=UPI003D0F140D